MLFGNHGLSDVSLLCISIIFQFRFVASNLFGSLFDNTLFALGIKYCPEYIFNIDDSIDSRVLELARVVILIFECCFCNCTLTRI